MCFVPLACSFNIFIFIFSYHLQMAGELWFHMSQVRNLGNGNNDLVLA